jgi:hypothetical protein
MAKSDPKSQFSRPGITPKIFGSMGNPSQRPGVSSSQSQPFVPQVSGGISSIPLNVVDGRNLPRKMGSIGA